MYLAAASWLHKPWKHACAEGGTMNRIEEVAVATPLKNPQADRAPRQPYLDFVQAA
jgi:hypothetical protein